MRARQYFWFRWYFKTLETAFWTWNLAGFFRIELVIMVQYFCKRSRSRFRLKKFEPEPGSFLTEWSCQGSLFFGVIANSLLSCMRFCDWILMMYSSVQINESIRMLYLGFIDLNRTVRLYYAHYVPYCLWRNSRNTRSIPFEPKPGSVSFAEILGHNDIPLCTLNQKFIAW